MKKKQLKYHTINVTNELPVSMNIGPILVELCHRVINLIVKHPEYNVNKEELTPKNDTSQPNDDPPFILPESVRFFDKKIGVVVKKHSNI
jgi:hypothetical protein